MNDQLIVCEKLSKEYQTGPVTVKALDQVDLTIREKEFIALVGPSGSGKSTLLHLMGGLDLPTGGSISVAGIKLEKTSAEERARFRLNNVGFIFQSYNLIAVLSAAENVEFVMQLQGIPEAARRERSAKVLESVGLAGLANRRPGELSGGQQQRVAVARAIVSNPKIILADEPTANLDSQTAKGLLDLMREMNKQLGITFIFSTHDQLVMSYAERIVKLKDGRIDQSA